MSSYATAGVLRDSRASWGKMIPHANIGSRRRMRITALRVRLLVSAYIGCCYVFGVTPSYGRLGRP
jgi:hypothetical protein